MVTMGKNFLLAWEMACQGNCIVDIRTRLRVAKHCQFFASSFTLFAHVRPTKGRSERLRCCKLTPRSMCYSLVSLTTMVFLPGTGEELFIESNVILGRSNMEPDRVNMESDISTSASSEWIRAMPSLTFLKHVSPHRSLVQVRTLQITCINCE